MLVIAFIPNVPKNKDGSKSVFNVAEIAKLLLKPGVSPLLMLKLMSGVPIGILQSMFSSKKIIINSNFFTVKTSREPDKYVLATYTVMQVSS